MRILIVDSFDTYPKSSAPLYMPKTESVHLINNGNPSPPPFNTVSWKLAICYCCSLPYLESRCDGHVELTFRQCALHKSVNLPELCKLAYIFHRNTAYEGSALQKVHESMHDMAERRERTATDAFDLHMDVVASGTPGDSTRERVIVRLLPEVVDLFALDGPLWRNCLSGDGFIHTSKHVDGCLRSRNPAMVVQTGNEKSSLATALYFRRCDGTYTNAIGEMLKSGDDGGAAAYVPMAYYVPDFEDAQGVLQGEALAFWSSWHRQPTPAKGSWQAIIRCALQGRIANIALGMIGHQVGDVQRGCEEDCEYDDSD